jgi:membrane-bound serine protease (ClpP class)
VKYIRRAAAYAAVAVVAAVAVGHARTQAPAQAPVVYVAPIEGMIDLGLAPFVDRVLREAQASNAAAVVLDINTFGGRVDAAVAIRDALLNSPVPTVAFVNKRAISAGALISLAATQIAMGEGATIGAATPVQMGEPGAAPSPVDEKSVSYVRKEFRATAEARGKPPLISEAMVDSDVEIAGLIEKGKLLTLTTTEAMTHGVADFEANTLPAVLEHMGLAGAEIRRASPNWAEGLVRFLTSPVLSSLLLSVGMLGIILEIRTPGFGFLGGIGVASLGLFLGGHWLVELAGWEELILVGAGLLLVGLEIFVIPGFGITGALGIAALLAGLSLSLVGAGAVAGVIVQAVGRVALSLLVAIIASLVVLRFLPRLPVGRRLVLATGLDALDGYASAPPREVSLLGRTGTAKSSLRPAGVADIDGERVDVVSDGEMIDAGTAVVVTRVDGNRVVVRPQTAPRIGQGE